MNKYMKINQALLLILWAVAFGGCVRSEGKAEVVYGPPMGWNSFDSYGVYLYHDAAVKNMECLAERYKEYGYNYFVIDAGWFGEFDELIEGTMIPAKARVHSENVHINEYGLLQPSRTFFPQGLKVLADKAHALGLKFGLHIMRGIPRKAYWLNTPVQGTEYTARDIADTTSICVWCPQNYGVDMSKPGAQEFYNSFINQLAGWGVDFIKADDIVPYPDEVDALVKAIEQSGRDIVLSLSPGNKIPVEGLETFKRANMLRVTPDIWDDQKGIEQCFAAWRKWQGQEEDNFYIDMDMIPFGELQIMAPRPEGVAQGTDKEIIRQAHRRGEMTDVALYSGKGWHRWCELSRDQQYTFITLRALSASALMIGGDLVSMDDFSCSLLTNREMIACNQNGVMGRLLSEFDRVEIWGVENRSMPGKGWIGIFNRDPEHAKAVSLNAELLGLHPERDYELSDIWNDKPLEMGSKSNVNANGVIFIKYAEK